MRKLGANFNFISDCKIRNKKWFNGYWKKSARKNYLFHVDEGFWYSKNERLQTEVISFEMKIKHLGKNFDENLTDSVWEACFESNGLTIFLILISS